MRKFFTLLVAAMFATMAWAGEITFNCADLFAASAASAKSGTYTFTTDGGSTAATLNTTSNDLRIYAGGTFKIETTGENFTKVVFTLSNKGKQRLAEITASAGTIATQSAGDEVVTWTGNAKSVTFTCGSNAEYGSDGATKAGQFDFTQFVVTEGAGGSVTPDPDPDPDPETHNMSIKIFEEQADGTTVTFDNPVTVLAQKGNYLYVKDATGCMLVYGNVGQTYKMGDVIPAGFSGTKTTYSGEPEMTNPTNFNASTKSETVYTEIITLDEVGHYTFGKYVEIQGVKVDTESKMLSKGAALTAAYYDRFGVTAPTDGADYDVIGIIGSYQPKGGDVVYQVMPLEFKKAGGTTPDPDPDPQPGDMTIAKFNVLEDGSSVTFDNTVTTLAQKGNYLYVKDATGYLLIYGNVNQTYKMGDVIPAGFSGEKTTYSGEPEMKNPSNFSASSKSESVTAEEIAINGVNHANFGKYVVIKGVKVDAENKLVSISTMNAPYFDRFGVTAPTDDADYDVYGIVGSYQPKGGDVVYQLLPLEFKGQGGTTPDPDPSGAVSKLDEGFETEIPANWTQAQVSGDKAWYKAAYQNNGYAAMTGYKGTTPPFDQWLISPALNIKDASDKNLTFRTQVNGYSSTTTTLEVYVLDTPDPATATTKAKLNPTLAVVPESGYSEWAESGKLNLAAYDGTYYIAFRYYATEDANYATWCVDDVKFNAEGGSVTPDPDTYTDATIADLVKLTEAKAKINLKLTDAVVLFADSDNGNKQMYVREGDNAIQFYNTGLALEDYQFLNGEIKVDYEYFKEFPEVKGISGVTSLDNVTVRDITDEDELYYVDATIADLNGGLYKNDAVYVAEVTLTKNGNNYFIVDDSGAQVQLYDKYGYQLLPEEVEEGTVVSVAGIFGQYYNGVPELYLLDIEGVEVEPEGQYLSDLLYYSEDGQEVMIGEDLYIMFADDKSREMYVTDNYYEEMDLSEYGMGTYVFYPSWVELDFSDNEDGYNALKGATAIAAGTITGIIDGVLLNPNIAVTSVPEALDAEVDEWVIFEYDLAEEIVAYSNEIGYAKFYYKGGKLYGDAAGTSAPVDYDTSYLGEEVNLEEGVQYEALTVFKIKEEWESPEEEEAAPAKVSLKQKNAIKAAKAQKARAALAKRKMLTDDPNANSNYFLVLLENPASGVSDVNTSKTVKAVKYYNLQGVEGKDAFSGVNVMVITYTDGTKRAVKVVK